MLDLSHTGPVIPGLSGLSCTCGRAFTRFEASGLERIRQCPACGKEIYREELVLRPTSEALTMLDDDRIKAARWYHMTRRREWHAGVLEAGALIHAGTEVAALTRAHGLRAGKQASSFWWLQEVQVANNASFLPGLHEDDATGRALFDLQELEEVAGEHDGIRYLNLYEDAGNVSLLIDPAFVQITQTTAIAQSEVRRHLLDALAQPVH